MQIESEEKPAANTTECESFTKAEALTIRRLGCCKVATIVTQRACGLGQGLSIPLGVTVLISSPNHQERLAAVRLNFTSQPCAGLFWERGKSHVVCGRTWKLLLPEVCPLVSLVP